ncbi:MAG: UvrD-helicase domain-containing protein [Candidatus Moraniibacteriota bacterium]|nr:MAG: UvrD-helicase domain-containing protein [Candidatus Moranbacteria bacterium]
MSFWETGLNPEQKRAVETVDGPVLILAGAGSGKTKTLTHRIAYLLAGKHVAPEAILAVTFTNKAAQEMRERIAHMLERAAENEGKHFRMPQFIGTFHNISARILRRDIDRLGYGKDFNIVDADEQLSLVKKSMKALEMNPDQVKPRSILEAISNAKSRELSTERFLSLADGYFEELVGKVYERYQAGLVAANALDFDDLILLTVRLFAEHPDVLEHYQETFRYILVDEYQDTNPLQYQLVKLLAAKYQNLFVIGDDYQSIYSWRQADIRNILSFETDYPEAAVITLDQNYRSTQIILDAATAVIGNNVNQRHKKLWTDKSSGENIALYPAESEEDEAGFVAREIKQIVRERHIPYHSFAVLYRTNAQSRSIEEAFLRESLPYKIVGGLKFYQRKEVKDVVAYVRFLANPRDVLALERIVNEPKRGIGPTTLKAWTDTARAREIDFLAIIPILKSEGILPDRKIATIETFMELFAHWQDSLLHEAGLTLRALLDVITRESGYLESLRDGTPEGEAREENVQELFSVAQKFDGVPIREAMSRFLEEVALASDTDTIDQRADAIHLMTVHSAKGLEFPVVFIVGLEEGIFPHSRSALSGAELEEERRLMYVALTRAKEKAYLIHADMRTIFGSTQMNPPSRFLEEIPEVLVTKRESNGMNLSFAKPKRKSYAAPIRRFTAPVQSAETSGEPISPAKDLRPGDMVEHQQFGNGLVIALDGSLVSVAFKRAGVKKMMLGVAPLRKV